MTFDPIEGLQLQRRGASGAIALASGASSLADGTDHIVKCTRAQIGETVASVDDTETLRVTDANFLNF